MEASGADLDQAQEQDGGSEPVGNGVVVVVGMFAPGDVVSLIERGENDIRAGLGDVVGRRVVDELGQVGFAGLNPGDAFFACGYSAGRYQEVRCVAQDPAFGVTLFQPTVAAVPTTLGSGTAAPVAAPAAPNAALEVGLPEGVTSPLLTAPEPNDVVPAADPEPVAGGGEEAEVPASAGEAAEADPGVDPAAAPASPVAEPVAESPSAQEGTEPAAIAASATTDDGSPLEAQGAGVDPAPVEAEVPAAEPATDGADASAPPTDADAAPVADQPAPTDSAEAPPTALAQLVAQAEGLGIGAEGATDEAVLRQSITEKGATPVA